MREREFRVDSLIARVFDAGLIGGFVLIGAGTLRHATRGESSTTRAEPNLEPIPSERSLVPLKKPDPWKETEVIWQAPSHRRIPKES